MARGGCCGRSAHLVLLTTMMVWPRVAITGLPILAFGSLENDANHEATHITIDR